MSTNKEVCCTFSVSGPHPVFQPIFVCHTCSDQTKGELPLCVCQSCADVCHVDHDGLEYVGLGPSYCDCRKMNDDGRCCKIVSASDKEAERLNVSAFGEDEIRPISSIQDTQVFQMQSLSQEILIEQIRDQASELVKHSRDTFWLEPDRDSNDMCILEQLALHIYESHKQRFPALCTLENTQGAEWWVQVKDVSFPRGESPQEEVSPPGIQAVDLHYDKDEALAESFGLGSFPALSTVTYLTESKRAPPTVIFNRCYEDLADEVITDMFLSCPSTGKHLVFDGRLLHGAPAHFALRSADKKDKEDTIRITFLVNVWGHHKPAGVSPLPDSIRKKLHERVDTDTKQLVQTTFGESGFETTPVERLTLTTTEGLGDRIELPFLGKETTWGNDGDSDDGSTTVVTFPPPKQVQSEALLVSFAEGLEAYCDEKYAGDDYSDVDDDQGGPPEEDGEE